MTATAITLIFEYGRAWTLDELPTRSIALDGAVRGPAIDAENERYSFDHHEGCIRHATLACCEQVYDALRVGLDPRGFSVFVNDVDADSVLGAWLLLHPEVIGEDADGRLERMVHVVGRFDALGPAAGRAEPLMQLLEPEADEVQSRATLDKALACIDAWWRGERLPSPSRREPAAALWIEDGRVVQGEVEDGFRGLYTKAPFGVLISPAPRGTTDYVVGKASEFVAFDVRRFLDRCNDLEPGWGGGSTIGGAPRNADGARSRLDVETISRMLVEVAEPDAEKGGT